MRLATSSLVAVTATIIQLISTCHALSSRAPSFYRRQTLNHDLPSVLPTTDTSPSDTTKSDPDPASLDYFFDQLLDHKNPSAGTFKQRYFFSKGFWTGEGAPIVLSNPGEQTADGFWLDLTAPGSLQMAMMEALGAAGIILEREFSASCPCYA